MRSFLRLRDADTEQRPVAIGGAGLIGEGRSLVGISLGTLRNGLALLNMRAFYQALVTSIISVAALIDRLTTGKQGQDMNDPGAVGAQVRMRRPSLKAKGTQARAKQRNPCGRGGSTRDIRHKFMRTGIRSQAFDKAHMMQMSAASSLSGEDATARSAESSLLGAGSVIDAARGPDAQSKRKI